MKPFEAYQTYLAITRHFTTSYDYHKYNGSIKASEDKFDTRNDRYFFEKAAKKYQHEEFKGVLISNLLEKDKLWIRDIYTDKAVKIHANWKGRIQALPYKTKEELGVLRDLCPDLNRLIAFPTNGHPILFRHNVAKSVSCETLIILDQLVNYLPYWEGKNDPIVNMRVQKLKKYKPFLEEFADLNKDKYKGIVLEVFA